MWWEDGWCNRQRFEKPTQRSVGNLCRLLEKSGKIAGAGSRYQQLILRLLVAAYRPLTQEELREALSVLPGDTTWNPSKMINDIHGTLTYCGSLISIDEEELTIHYVHQSVRQFLIDRSDNLSAYQFTPDQANYEMSCILVTYLNYGVFDTQVSRSVVPRIPAKTAPLRVVDSVFNQSSGVKRIALGLLKSRKQTNYDAGKFFRTPSADTKYQQQFSIFYPTLECIGCSTRRIFAIRELSLYCLCGANCLQGLRRYAFNFQKNRRHDINIVTAGAANRFRNLLSNSYQRFTNHQAFYLDSNPDSVSASVKRVMLDKSNKAIKIIMKEQSSNEGGHTYNETVIFGGAILQAVVYAKMWENKEEKMEKLKRNPELLRLAARLMLKRRPSTRADHPDF